MRKLALLLAAGLLVSACGGSETTSDPSEPAPTDAPVTSATDSTVPEAIEAPATEAPPAAEEPPASEAPAAAPSFDGPPAPEFELTLADGSTFSLADEEKPIYMVFWAEW